MDSQYSPRASRLFGLSSFALLTAFSAGISAAEYSLDPRFALTYEHDDNVRMSAEDPISLSGRHFTTAATFARRTEVLDLRADLELEFQNFNREGYDTDNQALDLDARYQGERNEGNIGAAYIRDSTRTSEFEEGRIGFRADRRELATVDGGWSYYLTSRQLLSTNLSYSDTSYDNEDYTDSEGGAASLGWTYILEENLRLTTQGYIRAYEIAESDIFSGLGSYTSETTVWGLTVGGEWSPTEQFTVNGSIGSSETETEYDVRDTSGGICGSFFEFLLGLGGVCTVLDEGIADDSGSSLALDGSLTWEGERSMLRGTIARTESPSSSGTVLQYDRLELLGSYRVSKLSRAELALLYRENEALDERLSEIDFRNSNVEVYEAIARWNQQLSEHWSTRLQLRYRQYERESDNSTPESWSVFATLEWTPRKIIW